MLTTSERLDLIAYPPNSHTVLNFPGKLGFTGGTLLNRVQDWTNIPKPDMEGRWYDIGMLHLRTYAWLRGQP